MLISSRRGTLPGPSMRTHFKLPNASKTPNAPPHNESSRLSVSSWRAMRTRFAPIAMRTAISFCRASARDSWRFATLAHAISSTNATAKSSTNNVPRLSPTTCSDKGTMPNVSPPFGG